MVKPLEFTIYSKIKKERHSRDAVPPFQRKRLLKAVFVSLDHLLDHLAADGTGLLAGQIAVVAVLQVNADLGGGLHLETVHSLAGVGVDELVAVVGSHFTCTPFRFTGHRGELYKTVLKPFRSAVLSLCPRICSAFFTAI